MSYLLPSLNNSCLELFGVSDFNTPVSIDPNLQNTHDILDEDTEPALTANILSEDKVLKNAYKALFASTNETGSSEGKSQLLADFVYPVTTCSNCETPVLDAIMSKHLEQCIESITESRRENQSTTQVTSSNLPNVSSPQPTNSAPTSTRKYKRRKVSVDLIDSAASGPDDDVLSRNCTSTNEGDSDTLLADLVDSAPKKRKTDSSKHSGQKHNTSKKYASGMRNLKGPLNLDIQCGVAGLTGEPCLRSLTCKAHPVGAKRAVRGRSQPYDILLAALQKRTIQNKALRNAQMSNTAASNGSQILGANINAQNQNLNGEDDSYMMTSDPDEEVRLILQAISQSPTKPLEHRCYVPVRRKHTFFRIREMLASALLKSPTSTMQGLGGIMGRIIPFKVMPQQELQTSKP